LNKNVFEQKRIRTKNVFEQKTYLDKKTYSDKKNVFGQSEIGAKVEQTALPPHLDVDAAVVPYFSVQANVLSGHDRLGQNVLPAELDPVGGLLTDRVQLQGFQEFLQKGIRK
jgi:hypothetical protein